MNIQKMMAQMQQMQSDMAKTQGELANKSVEASVGGGRVTATMVSPASGGSDYYGSYQGTGASSSASPAAMPTSQPNRNW